MTLHGLQTQITNFWTATQAGLDSLGAVELRNTVTVKFAVDLPATVVFDYPSVAALAGFVAERLRLATADADLVTEVRG